MFAHFEENALATADDAMNEFARNVGGDRADQAWILTGFDVWVRNPHYSGPAVRHPEDDDYDYSDEEVLDEDGCPEQVFHHIEDEDIPF